MQQLVLNEIQCYKVSQHLRSIYTRLKAKNQIRNPERIAEFEDLFQKFQKAISDNTFPITLQLSDNFYATFMHKVFDSVFNDRYISKGNAKEIAHLYMSLHNNQFPELFLENYTHYNTRER